MSDAWTAAPAHVKLTEGWVHVWRAWLTPPASVLRAFENMLSDEEIGRANRFRFEELRARYVAGRGLLRFMLGAYLADAPDRLQLGIHEHGKPFLVDYPEVQFNMSHSGAMALFAFVPESAVGVDVEQSSRACDHESLARRFFAPAETDELLSLPAEERSQAFLRCWTRKEAFIKAVGEGLSFPLSRFRVSIAAACPARLLAIDGDPADASNWTMEHVSPAEGFVGATVVARSSAGFLRYDWDYDRLT